MSRQVKRVNISGKENKSNKVTSWSSTTTDTHYPSEKLVKDSLDDKQDELVSGTNLKTLNGVDLLGEGDIVIDVAISGCSTVLFEDSGSASGVSNYSTAHILETGGITTFTLTWDTTENAYHIETVPPKACMIGIDALDGYTGDFKLEADIMRTSTSNGGNLCYCQNTGDGFFYGLDTREFIGHHYVNEIWQGELNRTGSSSANVWYHMELVKEGTTITISAYDSTGVTLLASTSKTYTDDENYFGFAINNFYFKNVKAVTIGGGSTVIFEDGGVTGNVNTNYVKSHTGVNAVVNSTGTTVSSTTYADCYYIADVLLPNDWIAEFTIVSVNAFGGIAFLNSSQAIQWSVEYNITDSPKGLEWRVGSTTQWISNDYTMPSTIKLIKEGTSLEIYLNDTLISTKTITDITGYLGWKTHNHKSRSVTFKDFIIRRYCQTNEDSENTIYLGNDIITMIDTALGHMITNWEDYE